MRLTAKLAPVGADITTNAVERLGHEQRQRYARTLRALARQAWQRSMETAPWRFPLVGEWVLTVHLDRYTALPRQPDADAGAWGAKRVLDGAVDAGVLTDDGVITEVHLVRPDVICTDQTRLPRWQFVAHLSPA